MLSMLGVGGVEACAVAGWPHIADARKADAVFVGYVTDYTLEVTPDWQAIWLAETPLDKRNMPPFPNQGRVEVEVYQEIVGSLPENVTILWRKKLNYGPPRVMRGGYVFAVQKSDQEPNTYFVDQENCQPALVFQRGSPEANAVRDLFGLWPEPLKVPRKTLREKGSG